MGGGRGLESSSSVRRGPMGFCWRRLGLRGAVSALIKGERSFLVLLCSPPHLSSPLLSPPLSSPLQGVSGMYRALLLRCDANRSVCGRP